MESTEIRRRFLEFFKAREHAIIPSAPLVTSDEKGVTNSTLFNTAGMQPLVPYLLGAPHPGGARLADVQKCLRTVDLEEVGDATHATFFEMLGNWSLGDYFKKEAIEWSYEFLTDKEVGLGLNPAQLYVSVFAGDPSTGSGQAPIPRDEEAAEIWRAIFAKNQIAGERIFYLGADKNWWQAGENGPCGPDTEMYYDVANKFGGRGLAHDEFVAADDAKEVVEIWNDVFMQYEKKAGKIVGPLPKPAVDTGAGLERLAMTLQGVDNIYDTDLLQPSLAKIQSLTSVTNLKAARIIADHVRTATFLLAEGVTPANVGRGYVLRRLLRRAVRYADLLELKAGALSEIAETLIKKYQDIYPEIALRRDSIKTEINQEELKFRETLARGMREFEKIAGQNISGQDAFQLFSSYGFPFELTQELAKDKNLAVDEEGFKLELAKHQELSRAGAEQKFKGGLAGTGEMEVKYHTATHLLHEALRQVLGEQVEQKGSNITAERLRFDFAHAQKMTDEEKKQVEDLVNQKISENLPVNQVTLPKAEAEATGARHLFSEKYADQVSIYFIGPSLEQAFSKEFCGGPHVKNTSELASTGSAQVAKFKIVKEEAVAAGVRRIKAVLA